MAEDAGVVLLALLRAQAVALLDEARRALADMEKTDSNHDRWRSVRTAKPASRTRFSTHMKCRASRARS